MSPRLPLPLLLGLAAVLLFGHAWLVSLGLTTAQASSVVFIALVLDVLLMTLAIRSRGFRIGRGSSGSSPWVLRMGLAIVAVLVAVFVIEPLRHIKALEWPSLEMLAQAGALVLISTAWLAISRLLSRDRGSARKS